MNLIESVPNGGVQEVSAATETVGVRLGVNGTNYGLRLDPRTTLLNLLREKLDLPGTKKGCDHGQCGACTVIIDGRRINSCPVSYTHLRAHETGRNLVCRLLLEK